MDEERSTYLSREESIKTLYELINAGFLNTEMENKLQEIANLISYELDGEHFWGQPYAAGDKLRIAYRDDLWTDSLYEEIATQHRNAMFIPCKNEIQDLKDYFYERRGIDEESSFKDREECEKDFAYHYGINNIH